MAGSGDAAMLGDALWADADRDDIETVARRLAAAMKAHLTGHDDQAARAAEDAVDAHGVPAHEEKLGDVGVAQLEEVAQRVWDVFGAWNGVWHSGGNVRDLHDPQRRLRWALDGLPEQVRAGLSLTQRLVSSAWGEFFDGREADDTERDVSAELRAVRKPRWLRDFRSRSAGRSSRTTARSDRATETLTRSSGRSGEATRPGTSRSTSAARRWRRATRASRGRSPRRSLTDGAVATLLGVDDPPREVSVTTAGISMTMP